MLEHCAALSCRCCAAARRIQARVHVQNRAVVNLFRGPNLIEDVAVTMRRLEEGDLKLRVRALDSERALTRVPGETLSGIQLQNAALIFHKSDIL